MQYSVKMSSKNKLKDEMGTYIRQEEADAVAVPTPTTEIKEFHHYQEFEIVKDYRPDNTEQFVERENQEIDDYEYPRRGQDAGLVVIFNHERFNNLDLRKGSRRDVNELVQSFGRVGYNIEKRYIHNDLTRKQVKAELKTLSELDYSERNSLIIIFLTHGESDDQLFVQDGFITTHEVWENFSNCPTLKNKPKMFIFQACKGKYFAARDHGSMEEVDEKDEKKPKDLNKITQNKDVDLYPAKTFKVPFAPDMLMVYATVEGNVSFRHKIKGSWFIQELCRNINAYGRRDDVLSLIIRTTKCVANNYFLEESDVHGVQKQMPLFISTLTKKFYLTKSKDRNLLLHFSKRHANLITTITQLRQKVDSLHSVSEKAK